jgi:methylmalonyl-CoA mutase
MKSNIFPAYDKSQWLARFAKELKGADPEVLSKRSTAEEFTLPPYFTLDEFVNHNLTDILPSKTNQGWEKSFKVSRQTRNKQVLCALNCGSDSLNVATFGDLDIQLAGVDFSIITTHFVVEDEWELKRLFAFANSTGLQNFPGSVGSGNPEILLRLIENFPNNATLVVNTIPFHQQGSNVVLEMAIALSKGFEAFSNLNTGSSELKSSPQFYFAIGTDFFLELARLRAFRILWANIAHELNANRCCFVNAVGSVRELAKSDLDTNLLRLSTMAISAITGTANMVQMPTYNYLEDENSIRITLNIHHLLKEEGLLAESSDPGFGAYYVEAFTEKLVRLAWEKFIWMQKNGGIQTLIASGWLASETKRLADVRTKDLQDLKLVKVGVNKFKL